MKERTITGRELPMTDGWRKITLEGWHVHNLTIASPGQLNAERVEAKSMMLLDDGSLVIVTKPFPNLAKKP